MTKVTKVLLDELKFAPGTNNVQVKIDYQVEFLEDEIGQKFRIEVDLVESDMPPDQDHEPVIIGADPDVLYTFSFQDTLPLAKTLFEIVTVKPDQLVHTNSVTANIDRALLNEDPGSKTTTVHFPPLPPHTLKIPHADEIRARVRVVHHLLSDIQNVPGFG